MRQLTKKLIGSNSTGMLLWGITIVCVVSAGAYAFRYRVFLSSQVQFDPNSLVQTEPNEADLKAYVVEDQNVVETMKAENLFVKVPPPTHPVTDVDIIGQEAIINGKLYKVGDKIGDAEIKAITASSVTIEWQGATSTFSPINGQDRGGGGPGRPGSRPGQRPSRSTRSGPEIVGNRSRRVESRPMPARPPRGGRRMPTPEQMAEFRRMSPERQRAAAQEWMRNNR